MAGRTVSFCWMMWNSLCVIISFPIVFSQASSRRVRACVSACSARICARYTVPPAKADEPKPATDEPEDTRTEAEKNKEAIRDLQIKQLGGLKDKGAKHAYMHLAPFVINAENDHFAKTGSG
jgi:hypothetical protein